MDITHTAESAATASDDSLERVADLMRAKGHTIRLRIPITLWDGHQYVSWKQEVWKVDVENQAEAIEMKAALGMFFQAVYRVGMPRVVAALIAETQQPE